MSNQLQRDVGEEDAPESFQILFSIPQIDSAFMRNPAGGGRLKIDIEQSTVAAVNAMLDEAVKRAGVTFAAAVVIVEMTGNPKPKTGMAKWQKD